MESNGKHVTLDGARVDYDTGAIFWGEPGTNGQHSFYQLIHQGTRLIPCDFIGFMHSNNPLGDHHDLLIVERLRPERGARLRQNARAGARAEGTPEEVVPHRVMEGNRPSNTILAERLDPRDARHARRPLRAQRLHPGRGLGDRLLRPVGGRARQGAGEGDHPRAAGRVRSRSSPRQLDQRADPPLPPARGPRGQGVARPLDALPLAASASNLLAARELMAFTLAFHIVLSCLGVALPAIILIANWHRARSATTTTRCGWRGAGRRRWR